MFTKNIIFESFKPLNKNRKVSFLLNDHNVDDTTTKIELLQDISGIIENYLNNDSYFSIIDYSLNIYNLSYVYVNFTTYSDICLNTTPKIISTENLQSYIDETLNNGVFIYDISNSITTNNAADNTTKLPKNSNLVLNHLSTAFNAKNADKLSSTLFSFERLKDFCLLNDLNTCKPDNVSEKWV